MTCNFPNCQRHATDNGFCIGHKEFGTEVKKKMPTPIAPRSKKMKAEMIEYKKKVALFLVAHKFCEIKSPVCTKVATCVNHKRRRGKNLLNEKDWEPACHACNNYCESHDKWAREKGHLESKFTKQTS